MILRSIVLAMALMFVSSAYAAETPTLVAADSTVTLEVKKMTWGGCVGKVKRALSKVEGVKFIEGNNKTRKVIIEVTGDSKVQDAIKAIKEKTKWDATVVGKK